MKALLLVMVHHAGHCELVRKQDLGKRISAAGERGHREAEALVVGAKGGNNELTQNKLNVMGEMEAGSLSVQRTLFKS